MYSFAPHVRNTKSRVMQRSNILKALAGTAWGQDKETIVMTYTAIGRLVAKYAAPIWTPVISETSWNHLEVAQNGALRVATGYHHLMASSEHLHQETKVLPIRQHAKLKARQYRLACHQPDHPGYRHTTVPAPSLNMKGTLAQYIVR